ncbi:proteasome inhibitor PI31 subunit-like [Haliotis rubra]|uniref:proteasome inhibitor PI31 subunit-like n=1 Tax=Haliotis rubra TaxID=36100 RepID=UPI001EE4EC2D|nr:proteasome inhibitor PI31 subunit-like [Haliotis rubra]
MSRAGLELLFDTVSEQLTCPGDAVICALHWNIVSHGFKCTGVGEDGHLSKKTERLPPGWNNSKELYTLKYNHTKSNDDFVLKVVKIDESLLVHFMRRRDEKVSSMNVRLATYTNQDLTDIDTAFKNLEELEKHIEKEILTVFLSGAKTSTSKASVARTQSNQGRSPLLEDDPLRVPSRRQPVPPDWMPSSDPFAVGRSDLDPLAGGMGGMLMDPRRSGVPGFAPDPNAGLPSRLPPGAVPPGARFDPFGPPGARPGPDPDHMKPPGYDDMFM